MGKLICGGSHECREHEDEDEDGAVQLLVPDNVDAVQFKRTALADKPQASSMCGQMCGELRRDFDIDHATAVNGERPANLGGAQSGEGDKRRVDILEACTDGHGEEQQGRAELERGAQRGVDRTDLRDEKVNVQRDVESYERECNRDEWWRGESRA